MSADLPLDSNNEADLRALVAEAVAHPDDEAAHQVLADWFEENGQADRAESLRLHWDLLRLDPGDERREPLEARRRELLESLLRHWLEPLGGMSSEWTIEGGLPVRVRLSVNDFLQRGEELLRETAVPQVSLFAGWLPEGEHVDLSPLAESPLLARVTALELRRQYLAADDLEELLHSPCLNALNSLDLGENVLGVEGAALLGDCRLDGLSILGLAENSLGDRGVRALLEGLLLAGVRELDLGRNSITDDGLGYLARSPRTAHLTVLDLQHNAVSDNGVRALLGSPHLRSLRGLDLSANFLGDQGVRTLIAAAVLRDMAALDVHDNPFGDDGLDAWRRSRFYGAS
jgi:uncharacterized protein (TIGR02996 family)